VRPTLRLVALIASAAVAAAGLAAGASAATKFQTRSPGVLTVGTELPDPPFFIANKLSDIKGGYEYDMVLQVAKRLGFAKSQVKFVTFPFNGLVTGAPCPCDFDVNGVSIFPDRRKVVDFSYPYYTVNQGVLVNKGTTVRTSAQARGLQWGAAKNSSGLFYLQNTLKPTKPPRIYPSTVALSQALAAHQIDAVLTDVPIVLDLASKQKAFRVVGQFPTDEKYGAVLKKGSPNTAVLSRVLRQLDRQGYFKALARKYFPEQVKIPVIR
jgi:polar amino acid transport system substrate-binding protein